MIPLSKGSPCPDQGETGYGQDIQKESQEHSLQIQLVIKQKESY